MTNKMRRRRAEALKRARRRYVKGWHCSICGKLYVRKNV